ncbi:Electron transport complex protein RnfC [uncultured Candidatus Thioglobus sp.]|nr:Electron transport complex protein RnfC [uncultured Candidatus Thioglobus sp.]
MGKDRQFYPFHGGLELKNFKQLSNNQQSFITPLPERMILPMQQNIGVPAVPFVKQGDRVLKGQKIATANGHVSVPVHASTSGKVIEISEHITPLNHSPQLCIIIEPDGEDHWFDVEAVDDYMSIEPKKLQHLIREAGIVGMGGAGFPACVKLEEGTVSTVDTLIINGVECEPYISCDDRIIREKAHYIVAGTRMLRHAVQAKYCVIAVEDDMPEAFDALHKLVDDDIDLVKIPTHYPAGGEKQLVKVLTGKEIPSGSLPIDIGMIIHNVGTAAAAYRAVTRGEPLISRYVTVSGNVQKPRNLQVLLGTPVEHCLQQVDYHPSTDDLIVMGGPMMGKKLQNISMPIIKTTNSILVTSQAAQMHDELPCIKCGKCVDVCPAQLLPQELFKYSRAEDWEKTREFHLFDCIECGCCAYVCPSHIPLVQYYREAKHGIAQHEKQSKQYKHTNVRFEARKQRLTQLDKSVNKNINTENIQDIAPDTSADKQQYIKKATQRTQAKKTKLRE